MAKPKKSAAKAKPIKPIKLKSIKLFQISSKLQNKYKNQPFLKFYKLFEEKLSTSSKWPFLLLLFLSIAVVVSEIILSSHVTIQKHLGYNSVISESIECSSDDTECIKSQIQAQVREMVDASLASDDGLKHPFTNTVIIPDDVEPGKFVNQPAMEPFTNPPIPELAPYTGPKYNEESLPTIRQENALIPKATQPPPAVPQYGDRLAIPTSVISDTPVASFDTASLPSNDFETQAPMPGPASADDIDIDPYAQKSWKSFDSKHPLQGASTYTGSPSNGLCPMGDPTNWDLPPTTGPVLDLDTTRFLVPVLPFGPNNQMRGFREALFMAIATNRTIILPPFFKHMRNDASANSNDIIVDAYHRLDVEILRQFVPVLPAHKFRERSASKKIDQIMYMRPNSCAAGRKKRVDAVCYTMQIDCNDLMPNSPVKGSTVCATGGYPFVPKEAAYMIDKDPLKLPFNRGKVAEYYNGYEQTSIMLDPYRNFDFGLLVAAEFKLKPGIDLNGIIGNRFDDHSSNLAM